MSNNEQLSNETAKRREWRGNYNPVRTIKLWGWDNEGNSGFIIFYGTQLFLRSNYNEIDIYDYWEKGNFKAVLEKDVTYTKYVIHTGKENHMPSKLPAKITRFNQYDSDGEVELLNLYSESKYNKGIYEGTVVLKAEERFTLDYFKDYSYSDYFNIIKSVNGDLGGFRIATNPNDILMISNTDIEYRDCIVEIFENDNIYMRKKYLSELMDNNPSKNILNLLLQRGSGELVAGVFLELAKRNMDILKEEAIQILEDNTTWLEDRYAKGLKRCAQIYLDSIDPNNIKKIKEELNKEVKNIEPRLITDRRAKFSQDKVITSNDYKKLWYQGVYWSSHYEYNPQTRKYELSKPINIFNESNYNNGTKVNFNKVKDTIQRAEAYGFGDIIGEIAYYIDTPAMYYYIAGNDARKELQYYKRYLRRIIDKYKETNEELFMNAMVELFTRYKEYDDIEFLNYGFQDNYIFNYYMKDNWDDIVGIWSNNIEAVLKILMKADVAIIRQRSLDILQKSNELDNILNNMEYEELINLAANKHYDISTFFMSKLEGILNNKNSFDSKLFFKLIENSNELFHKLAKDYQERVSGKLTSADITNMLLLTNIDYWKDMLQREILSLSEEEYIDFVKVFINKGKLYKDRSVNLSKEVKEILLFSTNKLEEVSNDIKIKLINYIIDTLIDLRKAEPWVNEFIEELIFSYKYEELKVLAKDIDTREAKAPLSIRNKQVISLIMAIKEDVIIQDYEIISILEEGSPKMVRMLVELISRNRVTLQERYSTLLIMAESTVTSLNSISENIFNTLESNKQRELHMVLMDSPVKRVYSFALKKANEIYGDKLPSEFIYRMLEHTSEEVKGYISDKTSTILNDFTTDNKEIFIYYVKTILLLPNKIAASKKLVYKSIVHFVKANIDKQSEVEEILLEVGASNIIKDSEAALMTLVKVKEETLCK